MSLTWERAEKEQVAEVECEMGRVDVEVVLLAVVFESDAGEGVGRGRIAGTGGGERGGVVEDEEEEKEAEEEDKVSREIDGAVVLTKQVGVVTRVESSRERRFYYGNRLVKRQFGSSGAESNG